MNQYFSSCKNTSNKTNIDTSKISHNNSPLDFGSIYALYKKEFSFHCEKLLLKSRNDILDKFFEKMKSIINYYYKYEDTKNMQNIIKKCENDFITNEYIPMYNALSLTLSIISNNPSTKNKIKYSMLNENLSYINNYIPHCLHHKSKSEYALHSCGEKLIQINSKIIKSNIDNNKDKNRIKYVLCPKCKKSYKYNFLSIYCSHCDKNYFSKIIKDCQLYPCTWEKYHCIDNENGNSNDIDNYKYEEQMSCVKCKSNFYINKKNQIFCKNCQFEVDPMNLVWTCYKCNKEFRSKIKIYNNLNKKVIKHIIRDALISQKIARPGDLPCDCLNRYKIDNINFYHKKEGECNGVLYYNSFNKNDFVVCSLCQYICNLNDFNWFCPFCLRYFISNNFKIFVRKNENSNVYIRKNILENRPKTRRYFSPKSSFNINIKKDNENFETKDKVHSDRSHLRVCTSQKNLMESYVYPNKIREKCNNNTKKRDCESKYNSQISTLFTSGKNVAYSQSLKYNKKIKSCNNSLDIKQKNNLGIIDAQKSDKKKQKSNLRLYISNKKLNSKFITSNLNKYNNSITKFIPEQKNNDNSNNLENMNNENIKLTKSKINISTSLINGTSDNGFNKESKNSLNERISKGKDNLMNDKIIYSNKTKRNKCMSMKKSKNNYNNGCKNKCLNKEKSNMKNKTQYNFSQKKYGDELFNLKKYKLKKIIPDLLFQNGIISQRNKNFKKEKKEKSCEM